MRIGWYLGAGHVAGALPISYMDSVQAPVGDRVANVVRGWYVLMVGSVTVGLFVKCGALGF